MRFNSISVAALSLCVGLGLFAAGCSDQGAASTFHPTFAGAFANTATNDGKHASAAPAVTEAIPGFATAAVTPGTTRDTANIGGTGGGPTNGADPKAEHRGTFSTAGAKDDGTLAVNRTGAK